MAEPEGMISYFVQQRDRWNVLAAVYREHLGPLAWAVASIAVNYLCLMEEREVVPCGCP